MTETLTLAAGGANAIGPGRLVLVVGPSGAGKDTLLGLAKAACADDPNIVFPRRVITRQASASEDNEEVSAGTFQEALGRGDFAMHWEAHGHSYALWRAIDEESVYASAFVGLAELALSGCTTSTDPSAARSKRCCWTRSRTGRTRPKRRSRTPRASATRYQSSGSRSMSVAISSNS